MERWNELWVEGEISDFTRSRNGHLYFTLDDGREPAQLAVVMFQREARLARAEMANGARVRLAGKFTLYESRGRLQLRARLALPAGEGDKKAELARLKKRLHGEGLFAPERKRPVPAYPRVIGVVTSRDGAAIHDVVQVARGRAPVRLVLHHCVVQGADAAASIASALVRIQRVPGLEVVLLCRGGGAAEDLFAFNEERVARAVAASEVPVVTGVGHGVDETLADLVADLHAATPSNAAERVIPDRAVLGHRVDRLRRRLERAMELDIGQRRLSLVELERLLSDPRRRLGPLRARQDDAARRLERAWGRRRASLRIRLDELRQRLGQADPRARLARDRARLDALTARLLPAVRGRLERRRLAADTTRERLIRAARGLLPLRRQRLAGLAARLDALSPLAVLGRGYAIALLDGRALLDAERATAGQRVEVRLHRGRLEALVDRVEPEPEGGT